MAALRFLLVAGLCSLASASRDDSSLFQREVGVHGPESGPEEPPSMAIQRIEATTRGQLLTDVGAFLEDFVRLATAVEAPVEVLLSEPVHDYEHWTAESMSVFAAGYVLAFRNPKFEPLVNKTFHEVSSACSKLGAKMETIAAGLGKNTKSVADRLAMKVVQISVQQASEVMIAGMSEVFDSMSQLLAELPTTFLKTSTKEMAFYVKHHTSSALAKFSRNALQPFIKKAFEEGDVCEHVSAKVADFGRMSRSIKDDAVEAAAKLRQEVPALGTRLSEIDRELLPHVVSTTGKWLEDFGSSVSAMGRGFKAYHEAIAEGAKAKLRCGLKK